MVDNLVLLMYLKFYNIFDLTIFNKQLFRKMKI